MANQGSTGRTHTYCTFTSTILCNILAHGRFEDWTGSSQTQLPEHHKKGHCPELPRFLKSCINLRENSKLLASAEKGDIDTEFETQLRKRLDLHEEDILRHMREVRHRTPTSCIFF